MQMPLRLWILRPSMSPWATKNFFVRKKIAGICVFFDFRRLIDLIITDSYPVGSLRDTLDWSESKLTCLVIDLKNGIFHVELHLASRECTTILALLDPLQYKRLLQGLRSSPGAFRRIFDSSLRERKGVEVSALLDGKSTGATTGEVHLEYLTAISLILLQVGMKLELSKCISGAGKAGVPGHAVGHKGLRLFDKHTEPIH